MGVSMWVFAMALGAVAFGRITNLENGSSCAYNHNCDTFCCEMSYNGDGVLGYFCQDISVCESEKKGIG